MITDSTINNVLNKTAKAYAKKYGKEISVGKVHAIAEQQFKMVKVAFESEAGICLDRLGKFVVKKGRKEYVTKLTEEKEIRVRQLGRSTGS